MANQEHLRILQQGRKQWNIWRMMHQNVRVDLSSANLSHAKLSRANLAFVNFNEVNLSRAKLSGANLSSAYLSLTNLSGAYLNGAYLRSTILSRVDLSYADLSGADLIGASFSYADLSGADLSYADLSGADFRDVNLNGTNFSHVKIGRTVFDDLNLCGIKGLETVRHNGPSGITTSTLERSEGDISEAFLRGAGLSDTFIEYARSLILSPIQYYTCFISYSSNDELFAKRLHNDLQHEGVRCWFAPEDMDIGDKIKHRIDASIRVYDKLLLILSASSLASSWVAYEVERALNKEPHGIPNVLYPVRIDDTILTCHTDWARDIKETRHIGNFEHWTNPEAYQTSFQRLLRALEAREPQQSKQDT